MGDSEYKLQLRRLISAPRSRVYAAWTQPELVKSWFAPGTMTVRQAEIDLRVEGNYLVEIYGSYQIPGDASHTATGHYVEIIPDQKLVFVWGWRSNKPRHNSLVTITFSDIGQQTEIVLTHEKLPDKEDRDSHEQGWIGCLNNLQKLFES